MERHRFDPVSAALGIAAVTFGVVVMAGEAADVDTGGGWWIAVAAVLVGLAIIPWRRPSGRRDEPSEQSRRTDAPTPDQPAAP